MPIYEYQCAACLHKFELMQKIHEDPVKKCPVCFKDQAERLISAAGFQLKGTGWYVTDFKDKGKKESKTEKEVKNKTKASDKNGEKAKPSTQKENRKKKGEND